MQRSELQALTSGYLRFAETEARGRSALYEAFARCVAADPDLQAVLLSLPWPKRQPNLLFAAVRHLLGTPGDPGEFRRGVLDSQDALRAVLLHRATQTNEPARCAVLLPLLAQLPQPLALIEVGASAGLCLLPDSYGYRYQDTLIAPANDETPVFDCRLSGPVPLPDQVPQIAWRAGLDLNPLDLSDPDDRRWLETLVWPEQESRLRQLSAALKIAVAQKPRVRQGDLASEALASLCEEAPKNATLVVFHTAVLNYLDPPSRARFADRVMRLCHYWIANESPIVFPEIAARAYPSGERGQFLLSTNGIPTAWADPHGASLNWITSP